MSYSEILQQGIQTLDLSLSETTQAQLLGYLRLLEKWNHVYNLTAITDFSEMIPKHLLDSLAVVPHISGRRILDVGTGAGLPGLVLAIVHPDWECTLLDSSSKKIRFVQQVVAELNLTNVHLEHARIEDFEPSSRFSSIICRAYTSLHDFLAQTEELCEPQGSILAMKGLYPEQEIAELMHLPVKLETIVLQVPQLSAQRHLIVMRPYDN
ncbi:16S rRNA (guanine(527)-N(7))-methyltransferase RsmG [Candidatus Albibeggiatoa sp. nov. BB20]|uniref:16S rRNA (guanine(527)-N(7))-methyltransferase RsmG n=1 Tax=Candidatus Albibeggiatoa sp. nov. BB20 TaxID=3162723 RepID=UPI0033654086